MMEMTGPEPTCVHRINAHECVSCRHLVAERRQIERRTIKLSEEVAGLPGMWVTKVWADTHQGALSITFTNQAQLTREEMAQLILDSFPFVRTYLTQQLIEAAQSSTGEEFMGTVAEEDRT
jgi:hypothetical protein